MRNILFVLVGVLFGQTALAAPQLQLSMSASVSSVAVGTVFTYTLQYQCASLTENCAGATVTDVLPTALSSAAADVTMVGSAHTTAQTYTAGSRTAKWTFVNPLPAGSTGQLTMTAKFPVGTTPDGAQAVNTATMTASGGAIPATSPPVTVKATASGKWSVAKTRVSGGTGAALNQDVVYQLQVCSNSSTLNLNNAALADTLPAGAVFVSASGNGTYSNGQVTFSLGTLSSTASCSNYNVTLRYPTPTFSTGTNVTNTATLTGTLPGLSGDVAMTPSVSSLTHSLSADAPARTFSKKASASSAAVGTSLTYYFDTANTGNVALSNFSIDDAIPAQLNVTTIRSGITSNNVGPTLAVEYQTSTNGNWVPVTGFPRALTSSMYSVNVSSLNLGTGVYITRLRYTYLTLPTGYKPAGSSVSPGFTADLLATDHNGASVVPGAVVSNIGNYTYSYNSTPGTGTSTASVTVATPTTPVTETLAVPKVDKAVVGSSSVLPGDTVTYDISLNNASTAAMTLVNPVIGDLLPATLDYVANSWSVSSKPSGMPNPVFESIANYKNTGQTLIRFRFEGASAYALPANTTMKLRFQAKVKLGTAAGTINNIANLLSYSNTSVNNASCYTPLPADSNDLDGDGNTTETFCASKSAGANVTVNTTAALESVKLVKGQLDSNYSQYPTNGVTVAGGSLLYRLQVKNVGNVAMKNAQIIDILPFSGDVGVLDPSARQSVWRPNLIAPVAAPAGVVVYYSTQSNLCRPELGYSPSGCATPNWSITPPDDITQVQALKFDFGNIMLNPLDKLELNWPMRAPIGAPTKGEIAWNSFGYIATRADNGVTLLPSEPIKVGIAVQAPQPPGYGNFVWLDGNGNGIQETGEVGLNGVRVDIFRDDGTLVDSTLTTNNGSGQPGYYQFTNLTPGTFYTQFYPPAGYAVVPKNAGSDRTVDSDVDPNTNTTAKVTLDWGNIDYTWDMGVKVSPTAALGNYVWYDRNGDGIQNEASNDGLNGVTVKAYSTSNTSTPAATTVTEDDVNGNPGFYRFDLLPGTYYFEFVKPTGATFTTRNASGSTALTASKADPASGKTASFSVTAGQYDFSQDAGFVMPTGSAGVGDRIWIDANNNGSYEPFNGELGVDGVRVNLYRDSNSDGVYTPGTDQFYAATLTYTAGGNPGYFSFANLPAGAFIVQVDAANFANGKPLAGLSASSVLADPNSVVDNDNNGAAMAGQGVVSKAFTLGTTVRQDVDFGFTATYSLGNQVFLDDGAGGGTVNDGLRNGGETGLAGVVVKLFKADTNGNPVGNALATQTSDASGYYRFDGVSFGQYVVIVDKKASPVLKKLANSAGVAADFAVGNDARDHGQDVLLADGSVLPGGVASAAISVGQGLQPLGETLGATAAGQNGPDGDANNNLTVDFGFTPGYVLGDRVWFDGNQDGIQQAGERGVSGVVVNLYLQDGAVPLQSTATDGSGAYRFDAVGVGSYVLVFNKPDGYAYSPQNQGTTSLKDSFDSDVDAKTGKTAVFTISSDTLTMDAGLYLANGAQAARIADFVWYDSNHDGLQTAGEPGLGGVNVTLWDAGHTTLLAATVSDGRGFYEFAGLPVGDYAIEFAAPNGYTRSPKQAGSDTTLDSNPAVATGLASATLKAGQNVQSIDAGLYLTGSQVGDSGAAIGDTVWYDSNRNGTRDSGEPGLPGVLVRLYDANDGSLLAKTKTDANGTYAFAGLPAGAYTVEFVVPVGGYAFSPLGHASAADPATGLASVALTQNQVRTDIDAGLAIAGKQPINLGNLVWLDANADLAFNTGEGLANAQTVLYDSIGQELLRMVTTAADANYQFTGLGQGSYRVAVDQSTLSANAAQIADPDSVLDSFHDVVNQTSTLSNIDFGYSTHIDFGDLPDAYGSVLVSNGARHAASGVYLGSSATDVEADGQPLADASGDDTQGATPDDENGVLLGDALMAGQNARLKITASAAGVLNAWADWNHNGTFESGERILSDKALVSGLNTLTVAVPGTSATGGTAMRFRVTDSKSQGGDSPQGLARSGEVEDYWLTVYAAGQAGSISGQVRNDSKGDGNLAANYSPLADVQLSLYSDPNGDSNPADGAVLDTYTTGSDGQYAFVIAATGNYVVVEATPAGYTSTNDAAPPNDDRIPVAMASFAKITGRDFLDSQTPHFGSISGQVHNDTQGDGNMAGNYAGLPGATLSLYTDPNGDGDPSDGALYGTATSDSNGQYGFSKLPLGNYVVAELSPQAIPPYFSTNDATAPGSDDQVKVVLTLASPDAGGADFLDSQIEPYTIPPVDLVPIDSKPLTDAMGGCSGDINPMKDASATDLETYRLDNGGNLVFAFNVQENKAGTETALTQGVAVKDASLTLTFSNGKQKVYSVANSACYTETYSVMAELNSPARQAVYTLIGNDDAHRTGAQNAIQNSYDSTLKCRVADVLDGTVKVAAADLSVQFMHTDTSRGDPETFYDCGGRGENLALLNAVDRKFIDNYHAGRQDAPAVAVTNPNPVPDPMEVVSWNYFPSADTYYFVAYEDLYPSLGDYDFNDAVVAYQVKQGMNSNNQVVRLEGTAYLVAKGAAYSHDWHLRVNLPPAVKALVRCTTSLPTNPLGGSACSGGNPAATAGVADALVFQDTGKLFPNALFTDYQRSYSNTLSWPMAARTYQKGPKSVFSIALSQPVDPQKIGPAPFDPYLYVRDTKKTVQLLQVNAAIKDANGYPYAMLMPSGWNWPYERTDIRTSYPQFSGFVTSQAAQSVNWHAAPVPSAVFQMPKPATWMW